MLNRIILIGRLGRDPELRYTPSGIPVSSFSIAVDRPMAPNAQGERETDWIDIVAWRDRAEFAANYLGKGRLIVVEGRLQIRTWTAQDGTKRKSAEVVADHIKRLDRPREEEGGMREDGAMPGTERVPVRAGAGAAEQPAGETEAEFADPFADE
jgi:single-strand DNA-binding protein